MAGRNALLGELAGQGFQSGFNYGLKPGVDRANSLADLKSKIDFLGGYSPEKTNVFQQAALGVSPNKSNSNVLELITAAILANQFPEINFRDFLGTSSGSSSPQKSPKSFGSFELNGDVYDPINEDQVQTLLSQGARRVE